eukprot:Gb_33644 [translate_table: standard]
MHHFCLHSTLSIPLSYLRFGVRRTLSLSRYHPFQLTSVVVWAPGDNIESLEFHRLHVATVTLEVTRTVATITIRTSYAEPQTTRIEDVIELYKQIILEWNYLLEPNGKEDITKAGYIIIRLYMEGFDIPKIDVTPNKSQAEDKIARITKSEDHAKEDIVECDRHEVEPENGLKTSQECIEPHDSKSIDMHLDNERYEDQPLIQGVKSEIIEQNTQTTMIKLTSRFAPNPIVGERTYWPVECSESVKSLDWRLEVVKITLTNDVAVINAMVGRE